jgi:hypothetical protein
MQTLEGEFTYTKKMGKKTKTQKCKWRGTLTPKQNKTNRIFFDLTVDNKKIELDMDVKMNKDATANIDGYIEQNGRKIPIHATHVDLNNESNIKNLMKLA